MICKLSINILHLRIPLHHCFKLLLVVEGGSTKHAGAMLILDNVDSNDVHLSRQRILLCASLPVVVRFGGNVASLQLRRQAGTSTKQLGSENHLYNTPPM